MAPEDSADPIEAIADLQLEVAALRQLLILLLAQQAQKTDDPRGTLEKLKSFIKKTSSQEPEDEYSTRVCDAVTEAVDRADWLVRAMGGEKEQL
jgi:hypothetical protein